MSQSSVSTSRAGFDEAPVAAMSGPVDQIIYESWMRYLTETLGREKAFAHERALVDVTRQRAKDQVEYLKRSGWPIEQMSILDLGSGHGTLAMELAAAGADVTAVEPCDGWREVAQRRTSELGLNVEHVNADGASLPFATGQFDSVVSLQVLEHVKSPRHVIAEIARVLKPGGRFFVSCENYLAFREQHYGVAWFPLLPRSIGSLYLRMRGRNPEFLVKHVTFTTWPQLLREFIDNGLIDDGWASLLDASPAKLGPRMKTLYYGCRWLVGDRTARRLLLLMHNRSKIFRVGFQARGVRR